MSILDFIQLMAVVAIALSVSPVCTGTPTVDGMESDGAIEKRSGNQIVI